MENLAFLLKEIFQEKHLLLWKNSSFRVGKMEHVKSEILQPSEAWCQFSDRLHLCAELCFWFLGFLCTEDESQIAEASPVLVTVTQQQSSHRGVCKEGFWSSMHSSSYLCPSLLTGGCWETHFHLYGCFQNPGSCL